MDCETDRTVGSQRMSRLKYSEMIVVYPTVDLHAAVRKPEGSWFVHSLCEVFGDRDLTNAYELRDLLDKVCIRLSHFKDDVNVGNGFKYQDVVQTSEYVVTGMSKKFYFPLR